jgi:cellulose synthase/poly-beta-1,6-N-acetylglucosamine synthase-like glycosyltransferase
VLVATCRDSAPLRACLALVREQARGLEAEVLVVVNDAAGAWPRGSLREVAALCDHVEFEPRVGKSHALNRGVALCRGEVIAFTDDDALPQPSWLARISAPLLASDRPAELVGCGGRVVPLYQTPPSAWYRRLAEGDDTHFLGPRHHLADGPRDYPPPGRFPARAPLGANCAYRREVFAQRRYDPELGPNRASGLAGGEDFELGLRLLLEGHRLLYLPEACVHHPVSDERTRFEFVCARYFTAGIEDVRMRRKLGLPLPEGASVRRVLRRQWRKWALFGAFSSAQRRVAAVKMARARGWLAELRGNAS